MADYTLSAKITGDSSRFTKALGNARSSSSSFESSIQRVQAKAVAMGQIVGNVVTRIAGKMSQFSAAGIKYNAQIEDYTTSFEVMTGSADKAADTVENLKRLGAATPFELTDLAETTKLLMNYGFTADDAQNRLMMLGDISQGSADKMQRIATAYGQMSSAGKVSLEDVKQMIEAGFNPLQEISESTDESMASLYDRISKGTISVNEITASMQRATSEGGRYFQSMEKQSQTFNGQMSTLKDNVSQIMGSVSSDISTMMSGTLLPVANSALGTIVDKFNEGATAGEAFKAGVSNAVESISEKFPQLAEKISTIKEKFSPIAKKTEKVAHRIKENFLTAYDNVLVKAVEIANSQPFQKIKSEVTTVFQSVKSAASTTFSEIKTDIENGMSPLDIAKNAVGTFADEVSQQFSQIGSMVSGFSDTFNNIIGFIQPIFETIKGIVTEFTDNLTSSFAEVGGSAGDLSGLASTVMAFISPVSGIIKIFGPQMGELVKQISGPLANAFGTLGSIIGTLVAQLAPLISSLMSSITSTLDTVIPLIAQLVSTLLPMAMDIISSLMPVVATLLTTIAGLIPQILPIITTLVTTLLPVIFSLIEQLAPVISQIVSIIADLFVSLMPVVEQIISAILPLITNIIMVISNAVQSVLPAVIAIINVIMSLIQALMPVITMIITVVSTVISTVINIITPIISIIGLIISAIMAVITPIITLIADVIAVIISIITPIIEFICGVVNTIYTVIQDVIQGITTVISNVINTISSIISKLTSIFSGIFNKIYSIVKGIMDKVSNVFTSLFNKIKGAWKGLTDFVGTIFDGIKNAVDSVVEGIKGAINFVINGVNGFLDIINAIPGVQIEHIQQLRSGTDNWQGGFAYMNEGGRGELVNLPNGSQVIPHDISVAYAKQAAKANANATMIIDYDYLINGITGAMCNVRVSHTTNLDGKTIANSTAPLIDRNLGDKADLEKRFGTP